MKLSKRNSSQSGFTVASLFVVILLIVACYFLYKFIERAKEDNSSKGASFEQAINGEDYDSNDVENKQPEDLKAPEVSKDYPIRSVEFSQDIYHVFLTAKLPGTFTGFCRALVSQNSAEERRYEEKISNQSSCKITIPKEKLYHGEWDYVMSFETSDGKSWGKHQGASFKL